MPSLNIFGSLYAVEYNRCLCRTNIERMIMSNHNLLRCHCVVPLVHMRETQKLNVTKQAMVLELAVTSTYVFFQTLIVLQSNMKHNNISRRIKL